MYRTILQTVSSITNCDNNKELCFQKGKGDFFSNILKPMIAVQKSALSGANEFSQTRRFLNKENYQLYLESFRNSEIIAISLCDSFLLILVASQSSICCGASSAQKEGTHLPEGK